MFALFDYNSVHVFLLTGAALPGLSALSLFTLNVFFLRTLFLMSSRCYLYLDEGCLTNIVGNLLGLRLLL